MSFGAAAWRAGLAACALVIALLAGAEPAASLGTPADGSEAVARADRDLLARILAEAGVERSLPEPSWGEYVNEVVQALAAWLLEPLQRFSSSRALWPQVVAWVLLAALVSVLVLFLARFLLRNVKRREGGATPSLSLAAERAEDAERATRDRETWRAEIERRLSADQVEAALEAVWWWLAVSLLARSVDPAWTSRELLAAANRRELSPLAATLDRMVYGPTRPNVPEIHGLVSRVEAALA